MVATVFVREAAAAEREEPMTSIELSEGTGRTAVQLTAEQMGDGWVVRIFNQHAHIGAVALGEYDAQHQRTSASLISRLGHKDEQLALPAAHKLSRHTRQPVCVIAGVHIDAPQPAELAALVEHSERLLVRLLAQLGGRVVLDE